jgi:uncharacterized C2H2 Zn-finger protein
MIGKRVICPGCKKVFYETTKFFHPDVRPNGAMLRLLNPWRKWGWDPYDGAVATKATSCSQMNCTHCGAPLAPSGRLTVLKTEEESEFDTYNPTFPGYDAMVIAKSGDTLGEFVCPECGKICKTRASLGSHMRVHKSKTIEVGRELNQKEVRA